jgi:hypothetical protein
MFKGISAECQEFSGTTEDGRTYHLDLVYDPLIQQYLMRTDQVGMKIIREIHQNRMHLQEERDSLVALNLLYSSDILDCDRQLDLLQRNALSFQDQLDIKENMLKNEIQRNRDADLMIKDLRKKAADGKVMLIGGSICVGVGFATILYVFLK